MLLLLAATTCLLGYGQKSFCRDTRQWQHEFQYTHLCYTDVVALWGSEGLDRGQRPYLDHAVEYPVLIGAAMQLGALGGRAGEPSRQTATGYTLDGRAARFFDATALLLGAAALVAVGCTALTAGRRPWDAALLAAAPALVLHAFTNWDLLAVAAAAAGLLAWSRRAPALAGVMLGLGIAVKAYPVLLLLALLPLCLRAGRGRVWVRCALAAAVTVLAVYLPVYLASGYGTGAEVAGPTAWSGLVGGDGLAALAPHHGTASNALLTFFRLNSTRPADWDSVPYALQYLASGHLLTATGLRVGLGAGAAMLVAGLVAVLRNRPRAVTTAVAVGGIVAAGLLLVSGSLLSTAAAGFPIGPLNLVTALAFLTLLGAVGVLAWRAPTRPRVPQIAFLAVAAFLLTNKVDSPQYVLWLLPLAALARPRWPAFLVWQLTEALVLGMRYLYFVSLDTSARTGVGGGWFVGAVLLRDTALLGVCALIVREVLRPGLDIVRTGDGRTSSATTDGDDPAGGLLRDATPVRPLRPAREALAT